MAESGNGKRGGVPVASAPPPERRVIGAPAETKDLAVPAGVTSPPAPTGAPAPPLADAPSAPTGSVMPQPELPQIFESVRQQVMAYTGPAPNPIFSKVTSEHVSQALNLAGQEMSGGLEIAKKQIETQRADRSEARSHFRFLFVACSLLFLVIAGALIITGKDALLVKVLTHMGALVSGALGGYGFGLARAKKRQDDDD